MSEVDASAAATAAWTAENEEEEPEPDVPYALMGMAAAALSNDEDSPSDVEADFERPVVTLGFDDNSFATLPAHAFEASLPSSSGASEFGDFQDGESTCACTTAQAARVKNGVWSSTNLAVVATQDTCVWRS